MTDQQRSISVNFAAASAPVRVSIGNVEVTVSADGVDIVMAGVPVHDPRYVQDPLTGFFHPSGQPELARP